MYGGSQASSKDMNLLFPSTTTFKNSNGGGGDLQRNNSMDVNLLLHHHHHHQRPLHQQQQQQQHQQQQQQMNTGLMRYRSAPSSLIANFIDGDSEVEGCDDFIPTPPPPAPPSHRSSSPEAETMFARFMSSGGVGGDSGSPDLREIGEKPTINNRNPQFMASMEQEAEQNGFPPASQMMFQTPLPPPPPPSQPPPLPMQNQSSNGTENSYRVANSMGMDQQQQHHSQLKMGNTNSTSNLIRHSSSPAGLFSHLTVENGFAVMRGIGNYRAGNGTNGDAAATNSRLKGQMSFSSRPPSSTGLMSQISEIESESMGGSSADEGSFGNGSGAGNRFMPGGGFPVASWDDSALENFPSVKRFRDVNGKMIPGLNSSENQVNGEAGNHTSGLTHHFSLPKNSAEMAAILQFQDSVPCKIRAKRGCATHPRSIAERVRRTRISERMRKLQELVPNMDKQTNTADMLDLAVDYIKDLQKQVKSLNDNRANCTCSNKLKA